MPHPDQAPEIPESHATTEATQAPQVPATDAPEDTPDAGNPVMKALEEMGLTEETADKPAATAEPDAKKTDAPADKALEPAKEAKPDDDLAPPEGMKPASAERWGKLTERVKAAETERDQVRAEVQNVRDLVNRSGLAPEEFVNTLEIGRLSKGTAAEKQQALKMIDEIRADLADELGIALPGIDPLEGHDDLKAMVENMEISPKAAAELALLRKSKQRTETVQAEQHTRTQAVVQYEQQANNAAAAITQAIEANAGKPGYEAKVKYLESFFGDPAKVQQFLATYQPNQWQPAIQLMYDSYNVPVAPPTPQPLRPSLVSNGSPRRVVKSMDDAVSNVMAELFG
jgi:hypothetical protein